MGGRAPILAQDSVGRERPNASFAALFCGRLSKSERSLLALPARCLSAGRANVRAALHLRDAVLYRTIRVKLMGVVVSFVTRT